MLAHGITGVRQIRVLALGAGGEGRLLMAAATPTTESPMRIDVIGGGPGGLYAARLLKCCRPDWAVTVHERNDPGATFGFGIGLSPVTLGRMQVADPATYDGLVALGFPLTSWHMRVGGRAIEGGRDGSIGLERAALLRVLADHAAEAGVDIRWGSTATLDDTAGADLVIAADGAGSRVREALVDEFGVTVDTGDLAYIWCGADVAMPSMRFEVVPTEHGIFTAHVMPYAADRCTFQVDATVDTVRDAGLLGGSVDADGTDGRTLAHLEAVFADLLGGTRLRGNRSTWSRFGTVRCDRWSVGAVVLIGDAAHTAHYTVGSGTRMAMEDALALADALCETGAVPAALEAYEQRQRPSTERLQARALRSQAWWTSLPRRADLPMPQLMVSYQTRTGAVGASALLDADPDLVDAAGSALAAPLLLGRLVLNDRVVRHADVDVDLVLAEPRAVAEFRRQRPDRTLLALLATPDAQLADKVVAAGADAIAVDVTGRPPPGTPPPRTPSVEGILDGVDAAEQLRVATGHPVVVYGREADVDQLEAAVLAGRADLVLLEEDA